MRWSRSVVAAASLTVGLAVGSALAGLLVGGSRPGLREATAQEAVGRDTYILSDPDIRYRYHSAPPGESILPTGVDPTHAGVSFATAWSGTRFPGQVWCTVVVTDGAGNVVGVERVAVANPNPTGRIPWVAVQVAGEPTAAEGSCEPGYYEPGPGYTFAEPLVRPDGPRGSAVSSTVHWATGDYPGVRACELRAGLRNGEEYVFRFTLDAPDGTAFLETIPAAAEDVRRVAISCSEIAEVGAG